MRFTEILFFTLILCLTGLLSTSCTPKVQEEADWLPFDDHHEPILRAGFWNDPDVYSGKEKIVIDRAKQEAYFYKGDTMTGMTPISTGKSGSTVPGSFAVLEKTFVRYSGAYGVARDIKTHEIIDDDFSTKREKLPAGTYYDAARMAYCLRYHGNFAMHQGYVTGTPESHGCIRVPEDMALLFYQYSKVGTPLIVR